MTPEDLFADPPRVHADDSGRVHADWALTADTLRFLASTIRPGDLTLETGAGVSTVLFALLGARHTAITPEPAEASRIRRYCQQRGIPDGQLTFEIGHSQGILPGRPRRARGPLDLVLIDGSHAFPVPFLDWYYTAGQITPGGLLVVDDTRLWTGRVLADFLCAEPGWDRVVSLDNSAVFRKTGNFDPVVSWVFQPYVTRRSLLWNGARWQRFQQAPPREL
jgi:predicted O-methyltransferase YrrM